MNRDLKSHTQFLLGLYNTLLRDMVRQHGEPVDFERDLSTLEDRVRNEGVSFLTKTLPVLAKAFDKALVDGHFTCPSQFKKVKGTAYPRLFQGLLSAVFCSDGSVKTEPDITAVRYVRQLLYLSYKYELPHKEETINEFLDDFQSVDASLGWECTYPLPDDVRHVRDGAHRLLRALLRHFSTDALVPAHGPGAVASGEKNWEKMTFRTHYECIHQQFPYYKFFHTNAADLASNVSEYWNRERVPTGIAKTVLVPKDSRGPRLISMEPLEFMWIQQGIKRALYDHIENHVLTRGHVNFRDQTVNRDLALKGSISSDIVTLDMKEASDRIPLWLVRDLFSGHDILEDLLATRTEATELPNGVIHLLRKFAPMGSALCFPIMSLVHWSLAVASLNVIGGCSLKKAMSSVYVYGDDIVIKGVNHSPLMSTFPHFFMKFNEAKCCTTGIFRESCGMDAVLGQEVTPLKLKRTLPSTPYDADRYATYVEYINILNSKGFYQSSQYVRDHVEKLFGTIPNVHPRSDVPGVIVEEVGHSNKDKFRGKWNKSLQRMEYRVRSIRTKKVLVSLDRSEYQRKMLVSSDQFVAGIYVVPRHVKLQLRWSSDLR